jgi:hypothetical protein
MSSHNTSTPTSTPAKSTPSKTHKKVSFADTSPSPDRNELEDDGWVTGADEPPSPINQDWVYLPQKSQPTQKKDVDEEGVENGGESVSEFLDPNVEEESGILAKNDKERKKKAAKALDNAKMKEASGTAGGTTRRGFSSMSYNRPFAG